MGFGADEVRPFDLPDRDPQDEISRLEARIDTLAEAAVRCRKFKLAAQVAMTAGGLWMLAAVTGAVGFDGVALMAAIAAVIGGIVTFGSNTATLTEVAAGMKEAEARRAALIDRLDLRLIGDDAGSLH